MRSDGFNNQQRLTRKEGVAALRGNAWEYILYTHYWVTWTVTEYRRQEDIERARRQELAELVRGRSDARGGPRRWRAAMLAAAVGRGWLGASVTMASSMGVSPQVSA